MVTSGRHRDGGGGGSFVTGDNFARGQVLADLFYGRFEFFFYRRSIVEPGPFPDN